MLVTPQPTVAPTPPPVPSSSESHSLFAFQAQYVVPSDRPIKTSQVAAIGHDLEEVTKWFATQTAGGVIPRWVPPGCPAEGTAAMSVVTVVMTHTAAEYRASTDQVTMLGADLKALGWPWCAWHQKLVVFIDVSTKASGDYCGINDRNLSVVNEAACGDYPSIQDRWPDGATYVAAHEMAHNLGAVDECAPHGDDGGHVTDDPRDVLYEGAKEPVWKHLMLDPGHDDYYGHGNSECSDIQDSKYWTVPPP